MICGVPHEEIDIYWPHVREWIAQAVHYTDKYSINSVYRSLKAKDSQLWICEDAAGITEIVNYPTKTVCVITFAGGERLETFFEALEVVENWARSIGCDSIEVYGRKAWKKLLEDYSEETLLSKELAI